MMQSRAVTRFAQLVVNGVPFVAHGHRRCQEQGWALLRKQDDDDSLWLVKILGILQHRHFSGATYMLVFCETFKSARRDSQPGPLRDALGLPLFSVNPTLVDNLSQRLVPAEQIVPVRICVVPHIRQQGMQTVLTRMPFEQLLWAAGFPLV